MSLPKTRLIFIDNLRIFLTLLVVAHHWAITNGAPGDTYYSENHLGLYEELTLGLFVATNQAFFMGFFFLISGIFVPSSYQKKGSFKFIKDRLLRLGIPLIVYYFFLSPLMIYLSKLFAGDVSITFFEFLISSEGFSTGPLWFVLLLLIFSLCYHFFRSINLKFNLKPRTLILTVIALAFLTFITRIYFPVGYWIPIIGIQPGHLLQYILCFYIGVNFYKLNITSKLKNYKSWLIISQIIILGLFPLAMIFFGFDIDTNLFKGGFNRYSLFLSFWEQLVAFSLIIGLSGLFMTKFNFQNSFLKEISTNCYAIYIFHGFALLGIAALFMKFEVNSFLKFILLMPFTFILSYLIAKFVRTIPYVKSII